MSRAVFPVPSPYRTLAPAPQDAPDPLGVSLRFTERLVVGWALLRVGVCTMKGLDLEGFLALVIVVTALKSLARSLA
jgi:hypothetical protein